MPAIQSVGGASAAPQETSCPAQPCHLLGCRRYRWKPPSAVALASGLRRGLCGACEGDL